MANTADTFNQFRNAFQAGNYQLCKDLLLKLKVAMTQFPVLSGAPVEEKSAVDQLLLARETLELACLLSIHLKDTAGFERHVAQVKAYYFDFGRVLPPSERQWMILGLNLVRLLSQNLIAEFHTELELIPIEQHSSNPFIKHPIQLEQFLMEGSYNKVLNAIKTVPSPDYHFFTSLLIDTVREEIANSSEKAYRSLPAEYAQRLLVFANTNELLDFINARGWELRQDTVYFKEEEDTRTEIPAHKLISQVLSYAQELERIV